MIERNAFGEISLEVVRARHRAALDGRCHCGSKRIPHPAILRMGSRTWRSCDRCFGTIEQLS